MQHLNYCRQMVKQFTEGMSLPSLDPALKEYMSHCIRLARQSQKFILPDGGRLYDDPDYRALDESMPLSLPFPVIAIEFTRSNDYVGNHPHRGDQYQPAKSLMFARQQDEAIIITMPVWANTGKWFPYPEVALPRTNYLNRDIRRNGYVAFALRYPENRPISAPLDDYGDEVGALLCMLNVLSCSNVHIEDSRPKSAHRAKTAGKRGALPFDSYKILTIDTPREGQGGGMGAGGSGRSPREHLRRGHIVRPRDRKPYWRNACVVNAGVAGAVSKVYAVR